MVELYTDYKLFVKLNVVVNIYIYIYYFCFIFYTHSLYNFYVVNVLHNVFINLCITLEEITCISCNNANTETQKF